MKNTAIAWADRTQNWWEGCCHVSPGCEGCYAEGRANRFHTVIWGPRGTRRQTKTWDEPIRWDREAAKAGRRFRVFTNSLSDFFENRPELEPWRNVAWQTMRDTKNLTWMVLTKRPENIAAMLPPRGCPQNVWLGTSVENADYQHRIDALRTITAPIRFLSLEPLLGPLPSLNLESIDWVIVGGRSGKLWRKNELQADWVRDIRDQCVSNGVAFFFKQWAAMWPENHALGRTLDGREWSEFPRLPEAERRAA